MVMDEWLSEYTKHAPTFGDVLKLLADTHKLHYQGKVYTTTEAADTFYYQLSRPVEIHARTDEDKGRVISIYTISPSGKIIDPFNIYLDS